MQKQILHNQSLLDIAVQNIGTGLSAFEVAFKNGLSVTDDLIAGTFIEVPESDLLDTEIVDFFKNKKHIIATGFSALDGNIVPDLGIGTMTIGTTFIVS